MNSLNISVAERVSACLFVQPYRPTDRHRYSKDAISISAGNSSTLHLDTGSSVRYRAMQLGDGTITTPPRLSARGWMSLPCKSCFPGWHFYMQLLGAALAFVAAAVLLMKGHLVSSSCKHMARRKPVLRLSPSGTKIITDQSYRIPETRRALRRARLSGQQSLFAHGVHSSRHNVRPSILYPLGRTVA